MDSLLLIKKMTSPFQMSSEVLTGTFHVEMFPFLTSFPPLGERGLKEETQCGLHCEAFYKLFCSGKVADSKKKGFV